MENNQKQQEAQATQSSATTSEVVVKTAEEIQNEFLNTGRIGRRNALGDILKNEHVTTNVGDLPSKLSALTTNDPTNQPGNSGTNQHSAGSNEPNK